MKTKNEYSGHKIRGTKITSKTFSILVRTIAQSLKIVPLLYQMHPD
jgi:hypothetical protein